MVDVYRWTITGFIYNAHHQTVKWSSFRFVVHTRYRSHPILSFWLAPKFLYYKWRLVVPFTDCIQQNSMSEQRKRECTLYTIVESAHTRTHTHSKGLKRTERCTQRYEAANENKRVDLFATAFDRCCLLLMWFIAIPFCTISFQSIPLCQLSKAKKNKI